MSKKIFKPIAMVAGALGAPFTGGASLALTGGLAGLGALKALKGKNVPGSPMGTPIMPMPDDSAVKAARRKQAAAALQRGGRTSTMLTSDETLG